MSWTDPIWTEAVYDEDGLVSYEAKYEEPRTWNWVVPTLAFGGLVTLFVCYAMLLLGGLWQ